MQNFGRGMWRRVGDYDRVYKPMLLQQSRVEQWKQFVEYQTILNRQQSINQYRQNVLKNIKSESIETPIQSSIETPIQTDTDIEIKEMTETDKTINIENSNSQNTQINSEIIQITPRKTKKKNKNKNEKEE